MISAILDDNLDRIRSDLTRRGITYDPLLEDMLDHICCMVEEEMYEGKEFSTSYTNVMSSIGEEVLPRIQHQTLLNLDKKFQRMKNFTYIFGLSSAILTIIGAFFKKMHWPGAGILITVGIVMVVLVFLPLYFITMSKEQEEKKNPIYGIVGYFTIALLLASALFKIMHWPGAGIMIEVGIGFLIIGFIPLYVVNVFQRSGSKKLTLPYVAMVLVGISLILVYSNVNMGKYLIDIYQEQSIENETQSALTREQTARILAAVPDSTQGPAMQKALQVHQEAIKLRQMIQSMQEGMKTYLKQPGAAVEDIEGKDNRHAGRQAILENGSGQAFVEATQAFHDLLKSYLDDQVVLNQLDDHLEFASEVWYHMYGPDQIESRPFINTYYILTDAERGITLAEYVAVTRLLHP